MATMMAVVLLTIVPAVLSHCLPGQSCWPSNAEVSALRSALGGKLLEPSGLHSVGYSSAVRMKDTRFPSKPAFVSMVETEWDVQESLSFARDHDLKISLKNTGHDFDGRCTAPDSFMLNVREMKSITGTGGPGQAIRVGAGNTWGDVHSWLGNHQNGNYTIVGGAIDSVGVTGWMQGGGHGDLARLHGLGVDNVLSVRIVVADSRLLTVSATENSDLFWALRGGGGGSWGIITEITYKIHRKQPTCQVMMVFPLGPGMQNHAIEAARAFGHLLVNAPDEVGGGEIIPFADPVAGTGLLTMYMRYSGSRADARKALKPLLDLNGSILPNVLECGVFVPAAWPIPLSGASSYLVSNFLDSNSVTVKDALAEIVEWVHSPGDGFSTIPLRGCFGSVIGGAASRVSDNETAVHPGFRKGLIAMSCFAGWLGGGNSPRIASVMDKWADSVFNDLGDGGAFVSEPQTNLLNWTDRFWSVKKYEQLLAVKQKYDPENIFIVHHGVGSESVPTLV